MPSKRLFRGAAHEDADPAWRVQGATELPPDSDELAALLADPAAEVRIAAAKRCAGVAALAAALNRESDPEVRAAIAAGLGLAVAVASDDAQATGFLESDACTDAIRADVARRTSIADRRRGAVAAIRDETVLLELALTGEHAETRKTAAEHVHTAEGLRKLADAAGSKDRGVARDARKRIEANEERETRDAEAETILAELEALIDRPGPILTAVIELDRRWEALGLADDANRLARADAARKSLQARFEREHEEQRARARVDRALNDWLAAEAPAASDALAARLAELAVLRDEVNKHGDKNAQAKLADAEERIERWTRELSLQAGAEALVHEAEQLAAGTSIDDAKLPERWQALDRHTRTPALTRRFEAAVIVIEQRRLAQVRAAQQEATAARQHVHDLLHAAEQALAAGQLQAARAAADEIRSRKVGAGALPKPTVQRLSRVIQQLGDLERWESFGQQQARVQLCERAEGLTAAALDPKRLAVEVQNLRNEWKALDQQHAGVPKALWERFDHACEKAYAPAARHFAEQAARRKEARKSREEFIAAASTHAPTLLGEPRDWRAIERWLRETEHKWREGDLGSVDPKAWKSFDTKFRAALGPARDALASARTEAMARRVALIEEATALGAKAMERDALSQIKAIQARWQTEAKGLTLLQRDERALWERFRAACDAVFQARDAKRKEDGDRKHEERRALDEICAKLEQLAQTTDKDEQEVRRALREATEAWRQSTRGPNAAPRALESRFAAAKAAVEGALSSRGHAKEAAVWQTLAMKERVCETLDQHVRTGSGDDDAEKVATEQWTALPALPPAAEKAMLARRDAAIAAFYDQDMADAYYGRMDEGAAARADLLLEIEIELGLDIPPELQARRLALQVRKLRDRFQTGAGANTPAERLIAWCAMPGVADARDRQRADRLFAKVGRARST